MDGGGAGVDILHHVIVNNGSAASSEIIVEYLVTLAGQCKPNLSFLLYRHIFKPLLDLFYSTSNRKFVQISLKSCILQLKFMR